MQSETTNLWNYQDGPLYIAKIFWQSDESWARTSDNLDHVIIQAEPIDSVSMTLDNETLTFVVRLL